MTLETLGGAIEKSVSLDVLKMNVMRLEVLNLCVCIENETIVG